MMYKEISELGEGYFISECGKVFSLKSNRFLKTNIKHCGYEYIGIRYKGKQYNKSIHRLVAKAFCEGYSEGMQVNHIDADKLNNNMENLEWVSPKENIAEAIKNGTHPSVSKPRSKSVTQYSIKGEAINSFGSAYEAERITGVNRKGINDTCLGKQKLSGGFFWKFSADKI